MKLTVALLSVLSLVSCVAPDHGKEAVLIQKPWLFGHGGVVETPVKTGLSFIAPSTSAVIVDMQPQEARIHIDDLMSSDGVPLDFDAVIRMKVLDSVKLISLFGENWYQNNVEKEFLNRIRNAVKKHGMNETAISTTAVEEIDAEVTKAMETYIESIQLPIRLVNVTVGKANPPDSVKNQRIETAAQEQAKITEDKRKLREDARRAAEESRAKADNAYREAMQMSPSQFLQLRTIEMQATACAAGHCTFIVGGSATPVLPIK